MPHRAVVVELSTDAYDENKQKSALNKIIIPPADEDDEDDHVNDQDWTEKKNARVETYKLKLLIAEVKVTELQMELDEAKARASKEDELQARLEKMSENLARVETYQMKAVQLEIQVAQLQNDLAIRETKETELEVQCKTLQNKLDETESLLSVANAEAKEQARKAAEVCRAVEVARALSDYQSAHLPAKHKLLMSEGSRMLQVLRNQVVKLHSQNKDKESDLKTLKTANQRLVDANGEADRSLASLSEKTKVILQNNDTLAAKLKNSQAQVKALTITQVELKEDLRMKNAAYSAEVRSRLVLEKGMARVVDIAQADCRDTRVVEGILKVADECDLKSAFAQSSSYDASQRAGGVLVVVVAVSRERPDTDGLEVDSAPTTNLSIHDLVAL